MLLNSLFIYLFFQKKKYRFVSFLNHIDINFCYQKKRLTVDSFSRVCPNDEADFCQDNITTDGTWSGFVCESGYLVG